VETLICNLSVIYAHVLVFSKGGKNDRFDEMHVAFAGLAQRYQAVSERAAALEAKVRRNMLRIQLLSAI
jgi:hypothetical protein